MASGARARLATYAVAVDANILGQAQGLVLLVLWIAVMVVLAISLLDAIRQPAQAFPAVGRLSKPAWLAILGVGLALTFVAQPLGLLWIISAIAGIVYLVDTKPKLRQIRGGGSSRGPYGGW